MDEERLPLRSEVPEKETWKLEDIFAADEEWFSEYEALKNECSVLEAFRGKLAESAENLLMYLRKNDELSFRLGKLVGYASCRSDQDTADNFYLDMRGKAVSVCVELSGACSFAAPEIVALSEDTLNLFYTVRPELEEYRRALYLYRRTAEHVLSDKEEALLAAAGELSRAPDNISGALRNADMSFPKVKDSENGEHLLTPGTFVMLEQSADRTLRENAFRAVYGRYSEVKNTVAATLDAQFRQLLFFSRARKYPDTLTASLYANEVPVEVYLNLIEAVHANLDKMYGYVSMRKKALGVEKLHMYDVYVPIVPVAEKTISFEEAKTTVLGALSVLGERYTELLKKGFDGRWIDVRENKGKRGGAYSNGNARPHPFVLLNHKDNLDSMFTVAHEMGHALHSYLSAENQPQVYSDYVIFVAEVASTCNEILLMRYLLDRTENRSERAYLINHFLEEFKGTLFRQTMFAEFELEMGRMVENGETLTAETLCEKYIALNRLYFGPDMVSDEEIALEWARIPHFFYDYYVFQYATGFSAAVAIAERILSGEEHAVENYLSFLSGGCSSDPITLLKTAGVDMSTPQPVNSALRLFGELTEELDSLINS